MRGRTRHTLHVKETVQVESGVDFKETVVNVSRYEFDNKRIVSYFETMKETKQILTN